MHRMSGLLSRMLNDNPSRQRNRVNNENRIAEGISMLLSDDHENDGSGTSNSTENNSSGTPNTQPDDSSSSSHSSSEEDESLQTSKFNYVRQKFVGHRNARTMIKESNFWGDDFVRKAKL